MNRISISFTSIIIVMAGLLQQAMAQPRIGASNQNYMQVSSSQTQTFSNAYQVQLSLEGNNKSYPNWSLATVLNQQITNSEGKTLPYNKIKLKLSAINGTTFQQIGSGTTIVPLNSPGIQALLISSSNYPLTNGNEEFYKNIVITIDVILEGGSYLDALKTWQAYSINLAFVLLDKNGTALGRSSAVNGMQIRPDGNYTTPASYGIQIQDNARSGLLELKTMADYTNGASVSYANGLTVTAATPFAIQVRTSSANFTAGNNSLPVSVVNLQLSAGSSAGATVALSEARQTIGTGGSSTTNAQAYKYNLRYFTKANDNRLMNAVPNNYSGILIYEIIPQ